MLARFALGAAFGQRPLMILFICPIIVCAYAGGLAAGLVATFLSAALIDWFMIPPTSSLWIDSTADLAGWSILVLGGVLISVAMETLHRRTEELRKQFEMLRETEEQLRQAQKMESVGRLAGGIAHDFNNMLSVIIGSASLCLDALGPDDPMRTDVEQINLAADRAASLTRQLLAFSRRQVLAPKDVNLNDVVGALGEMVKRLVGEHIEVRVELGVGLGTVRVDVAQLEQVLLNLVVNARDAMPSGGRLTIETRQVLLGAEAAREHPEVTPGPHVSLSVRDTGTGMDRATRERIFEPFFTTKAMGKGTGLGLSMAYGTIKQSGGSISVDSEPGKGTTFTINLPVVSTPGASLSVVQPAAERARGSEMVLIVEDEPQVRRVAARVLRRAGYVVLEAARADEALELVERTAGPLQLLITDVVMPQMNGRALAEKVLARQPQLRVLYMSGYADSAIVEGGVLGAGVNYLQKPFTPDVLVSKVHDVLASGHASFPKAG